MKQEEISVSASCLWPPGPQLPQCVSVTWLLWAQRNLLAPPDTVPSLEYHTPSLWGQEGVNATRKGLWGRKKAVPTRLRCQGEACSNGALSSLLGSG